VAVIVRASDNLPLASTTVTFSASAGTLTSTSVQTDASGRAAAGTWTLGTTAGNQTVTAQAGTVSAQLVATAAAGPIATLEIVTGLPAAVRAGQAITPAPAVRGRDQFNNIVNRAGTVITAVLQAGVGVLTGANATTDAAGLATFNALSIGGLVSGGPRTIAFSTTGAPVAGASAVTLQAGPAASITLANVPTTARAGVPVDPVITATVSDQFSNPLASPSVAVTATLAQGSGTLAGATANTNASGQASFPSLAFEGLVGNKQLRFSAEGVNATTPTIQLFAGDPSSLAVVSQPTQVENTILFPAPVVVRTADRFGNGVSSAGRTVSVSLGSGGGVLQGSNATTDAVGVAAFNNLRLVGSVGPRTLTFSTTGLTAITSAPITLNAGPPRSMAFFQPPSGTVTSGVPWVTQPALQLADTSGNVVRRAGFLVRATLLDANGELLNDVATTSIDGLAIFDQLTFVSATALPPPTLRLRFSSGAFAAVVTGNVNINPPQASPVQSVVYGNTSQRLFVLDPGASLNISAVARDLLGAVLPGVSLVYNSGNSLVASVRNTGAITGVGSGTTWVRAFGSGAPAIKDSVYVTVPLDPTAPVVSTTQISPIVVRNGVTTGFDVVLDTRDATIGAATILLGFPPELVSGITWQGVTGTIIAFDNSFHTLRISLVNAQGLKGIFNIARVTVTSGPPDSFFLNRHVIVTPLEMVDVNFQNLAPRSTGVNIPLVP